MATLRPKIRGTVLLEQLVRAHPVEWIVLFSSTTALLGASGLAHYAAANAFLDASARAARRDGRPMTSIDWGTWEVMRLVSETGQQSYREAGLEPIAIADACDAMSRALRAGQPNTIVARVDWSTLKPLHEARRRRPFLARMSERAAPTPVGNSPQAQTQSLSMQLQSAPAETRGDIVTEFVAREVAAVLGVDDGHALAPTVGLFEMGMDSLMSVELRKRLERGSGLGLPSTLTFNYPNIRALASFLDGELSARREAPIVPAHQPPAAATNVVAPPPEMTDLAALSDEELEARLLARLENLR
jgi:hypothetical protein